MDFIDVALILAILGLLAFAVYSIRTALQELKDEEQLLVDVKNMHYVPFSLHQLQNAVQGLTSKEKNAAATTALLKEFVMKLDLLYAVRYHLLNAQLLEDYEPFDPNRENTTEIAQAKLMQLEDRFLSNFRFMLEKANYSMLTEDEAETASAHNFLNTVPIEPEFVKMDPVFQRYMELHPEFAEQAFKHAERIWIFHRGVGVAKFEGMLIMQKLDSLLFRMFGRCCGKRNKLLEPPTPRGAPNRSPSKSAVVRDDKGKEEASPSPSNKGTSPPALDLSSSAVATPVDDKKPIVQRMTIKSNIREHGWGAMLKSSVIQEPTFKEIVICYRVNQKRDAYSGSANPNSLNVKIFRDIPHADMEVLYPCKHTTLRPLDVVKFVGAGIFGLVSVFMQRRAGELVGYSALTGFITVAVSVLFDYQYNQSVYEQMTLRDLYAKSKDSDRGAVNYLMGEVGIQEVKEVFLAYFFLWHYGKPMTEEQLDSRVEEFLSELQTVLGHRECKIDFEVDDALGKLKDLKLITEGETEGTYVAVPLEEAIDELNHQWGGLILAANK